ncbi:GNAT family N-acetyltransferase [Paenibacillus periandrae]|uniref:GNAT family N-acetyltransferase n=1 Tax=Paenibacillus periandrae TaxID=1761741 RepID=UPI001F091906|nr:GNAT family N-acetyltransferase [Paenibacillus periandrae]
MTLLSRKIIEEDWDQIKSIYLEGISTGNATFQTEAPPKEQWFSGHVSECSIVCTRENIILGWAALSRISARAVYSGVAEVSIYIRQAERGNGVGDFLMKELVELSEMNGFWTLQAGIFPENIPSLKLHYKHGFREVGRREKIGKMNELWRDVMFLERRSSKII